MCISNKIQGYPGEACAIGPAVRIPLQGEGTKVLLLVWNRQGERSHREVEAEIKYFS